MESIVTGLFPDRPTAERAAERVAIAGIPRERIRVVDAYTRGRHSFLRSRTSDTGRGLMLGVLFGVAFGTLVGSALPDVFGPVPSPIAGAVIGAVAGIVLGLCVGRATTKQVQDELEEHVDHGKVLVSVRTDSADAQMILTILDVDHGPSMVTTATSFQSGTTPTPEHERKRASG